jgi:anti-sigma regulatory factor (Ser/Thr protein kinase)
MEEAGLGRIGPHPGGSHLPAEDTSESRPETIAAFAGDVVSVDGTQQWHLTGVTPEPEQVPLVRRRADQVLHEWALDQLQWAVELLLNEVAGNVVRHAHTPYDVTMTWDRHTLRVSVRDTSSAPPLPRIHVPETESSGRGLLLVTKLAERWGWEPDGRGKVVWFEIVPLR